MKRLIVFVLCLTTLGLANAATDKEPLITVTLLGTGVPLLNAAALKKSGRALSGLLVQAGSERLLFDCGQGVYDRLIESGGSVVNPNIAVDKVFLSHLHSDHIGDLAPLYAVGALYRRANPSDSPTNVPLKVWGPAAGPNQPVGTWAMMQNFRIAFDTDFYVRQLFTNPADYSLSNAAVETENSTTELREGVVYSNAGVTVTAFQVDHDPVSPSYGFRVDYAGHSFVYSGDTAYNQNLIDHSKGVDLLVHEVYGYPSSISPEIAAYHTSPEQAAKVFNATQPKQAVYTHLVIPPYTTAQNLVDRTRTAGYKGPLKAGRDLMVININSDSSITITPPPGPDNTKRKAESDFIEIGERGLATP